MDREAALDRLPQAYAIALRLHAENRDDVIAECLGIAPEGIAPLLRLAEAKLARLLADVGPRSGSEEGVPRDV